VSHLYFREQSIKKVYVGGIPYYSSEDDIRSFFEACGSITMIDCMNFPESGKFRGIAILTFKVRSEPVLLLLVLHSCLFGTSNSYLIYEV
jgi:RNA recognition motif-containing protein